MNATRPAAASSAAGDEGRLVVVEPVAEIRRRQRRLAAIGPMHKQRLARDCGAEHRRDGTLEEAISDGERQGVLRRLPLGWIEATSDGSDSLPR